MNRSSTSPAAHASTSSHVTGVDTVGSGRARIEYGRRSSSCGARSGSSRRRSSRSFDLGHHGRDTTWHAAARAPGPRRARNRPRLRACMPSCSSARTSAGPSTPTSCTTPRDRPRRALRVPAIAISQQSTIVAGAPGSKSNTSCRGVSRSSANAIGTWISRAAMLAAHTNAACLVDPAVADATPPIAGSRSRRRPTRAGASGIASRRTPSCRRRSGYRRNVRHRPLEVRHHDRRDAARSSR